MLRFMRLLPIVVLLTGCASTPPRVSVPVSTLADVQNSPSKSEIVQVSHVATKPRQSLNDFIQLTLDRHPRLAQAGFAVEAARGQAIQAGLYPNPVLNVTGDELGDSQGPGGIWTAPMVSQEIIRGDKLKLSQAVAFKDVDQATLTVISERYRLITDVRKRYYEILVLQKQTEMLQELVGLAEKSVENANKLLKAKEGSELDVVQLEVDLERFRAELDAVKRSLPSVYRQLAATVGDHQLPIAPLEGDLTKALPEYNLESIKEYVVQMHPDKRSAQVGVDRAQLALQRAIAEPTPNVTVGTGYVRQNQNRSHDWMITASLPLPIWNKNQGGIAAARANLSEAALEVSQVENDLVARLSTSHASYVAARSRYERYRTAIIPKAEQSYQLSLKAFQGGQFEYLRVLQAQRSLAEARLESLKSLSEVWQSASTIAGLMLEDRWPE